MDGGLRARVEADLDAGRFWKARDRLTGAFANRRDDLELVEWLGEVYARMGDLPAAGRWWFFTDGDDERHELARQLFVDDCGARPDVITERLPPVAASAPLAPAAAARLDQYDFTGWNARDTTEDHVPEESSPAERAGCWLAGFALVLLTAGVWLAGAIWLVGQLF